MDISSRWTDESRVKRDVCATKQGKRPTTGRSIDLTFSISDSGSAHKGLFRSRVATKLCLRSSTTRDECWRLCGRAASRPVLSLSRTMQLNGPGPLHAL